MPDFYDVILSKGQASVASVTIVVGTHTNAIVSATVDGVSVYADAVKFEPAYVNNVLLSVPPYIGYPGVIFENVSGLRSFSGSTST